MIKSEERIQNIKEYILEFQFTYHRTPTMAQIAEAVGTVKSNVYKYLSEMEDRGILARSKREIEINDTIQASPELNRVPILGNVSCGLPEYTEENFEEYVPLPVALFGQGDFFLLRASGYSMIEAGIEPGDLVVVRKQNTAEEGDTHVTIDCEFLESESTLLLEQIRTIDKIRLSDYLGQISKEDMERVETAMAVSLGFGGAANDRERKRRCSESLSLLQHQYASPSAVHAADYRGRIQPHPPPHNRAL